MTDPGAFRRRLLAGETLLGAWNMLGDPYAAEILGRAGYDWIVVDMEHGPMPLDRATAAMTAIRTTDACPIVRAPWKDSASVQVPLDAGARGILVPMIDTVAEAKRVVADARFEPLGERSRGGSRTANAFGRDAAAYYRESNEWTAVMVQVETRDAVAAAPEVAALDGIDCLFVGPNDLAGSYRVPFPEVWAADLTGPYGDAIVAMPKIARACGKVAGILANDATMAKRCRDLGYTVIGLAVDTRLLLRGAVAAREAVDVTSGDA